MSPPMIDPARTSRRARGRSATARTAAAMFSSPTSGIVSTLIRSPRRLWRSASLTAPSATWATCAPPPTTMTRLPNTRSRARVSRWARTPGAGRTAPTSSSSSGPRPRPRARPAGRRLAGSIRRTVRDVRIVPPAAAIRCERGRDDVGPVGETRGGWRRWSRAPGRRASDIGRQPPTFMPRSARPATRHRFGSRPPSGRAPRRRGPSARTPRGSRGVAGGEHQRAVGVLGDADDARDVHAALAERGRDAREGARLVVELDREPDRHAATSSSARW